MNTNKLDERYSTDEIKTCKRKKRFLTRESAIYEHIRKHQKGLCDHFLKPYKCVYCRYWHLTKDEEKNLWEFKAQQELKLKFGLANLEELDRKVKKIEKGVKKKMRRKKIS